MNRSHDWLTQENVHPMVTTQPPNLCRTADAEHGCHVYITSARREISLHPHICHHKLAMESFSEPTTDESQSDMPSAPMCFRIAGVPLDWTDEELLRALQEFDPSLRSRNAIELSLYPACFGSTQTALLNLRHFGDYFQNFPPNEPRYERIARPNEPLSWVTIDSHFYDLTPLNNPEADVIAELVLLQEALRLMIVTVSLDFTP